MHKKILLIFLTSFVLLSHAEQGIIQVVPHNLAWDQPPVLPPHCCPPEDLQQIPCAPPSGRPISYGRDLENALVTIRPFGYAKWEGYWDTRKEIGFREEHTLLFPAPKCFDQFGRDINAHGIFTMTAFETRLGFWLNSTLFKCIKFDGLVEGDFLGSFESTVYNFRLRNAFGRLTWDNGSFLFGQWWHPLWVPECFPHTVGYNNGTPIDPVSRDPQLTVRQRWNDFELIASALSQSDFASNGPCGFTPDYIRHAVIPNFHVHIRKFWNENIVGLAGDYKRIAPRKVSNKCIAVDEYVDSFIVEAYAAIIKPPWSARAKIWWAQNGTDVLLLSGYGVRTIDPVTDKRTYSPTAAFGIWGDFSYIFHCDRMEVGFFTGYTKNLGSHDRLCINTKTGVPIIYALVDVAQNIDYVFQAIPRFVYMYDPFRFGAEIQYNKAAYGKPDCFAKIQNACPVDSLRIYFALYYMF